VRLLGGDSRWLWTIVLLGAALRFFPIWFGLPYLRARPDEDVAVLRALGVLNGDLNPQFFHWPSLTFYAFAGVFAAARAVSRALFLEFPLPYEGHLLLARGLVALVGTLTIVVLFTIGRRIADTTTAVLAALFLAVAILHVRDSHFAMTDVLMTFFVMLSLSTLLRATAEALQAGDSAPSRRWFAAAGLFGGLAASTKYNAAAIIASMSVAQAILLAGSRRVRRVSSALDPSFAFLLAFPFGFLVGTPYALFDWPTFWTDFRFTVTHLSVGHGVDLGPGWIYHPTRSLPYGVGLSIFIAALAGIVPFARHYVRYGAIVAGFAVALYVALGSGRTVFFRYIMPLVPIVCLLAAVGVRHLAAWIARRGYLPPRASVALLTVVVAGPPLVNSVWMDVLLARADTRLLAERWLSEHVRPEDSVYDGATLYSRLDLSRLQVHQWHFDVRTRSFGHPEGKTPDWLVFHESPLRQYAGVPWQLRQVADLHYTRVATFPATRGRARSAVYDHQDAFFLPLSNFHTVIRPGPSISIYRRNPESITQVRSDTRPVGRVAPAPTERQRADGTVQEQETGEQQ
jgi:4-amino-4-deoxy-L-arabinose transferase-like glycosyltransferase